MAKEFKKAHQGRIFGSEGLAINISVYVDGLDTEFYQILAIGWQVISCLSMMKRTQYL